MTGPVVAAFDFDGTLTRSDTVVPFLRRVARVPPLAARLTRQGHHVAGALARRDRDRLRAIATEMAFSGMPSAEVDALARDYGAEIVAGRLRDDTVARLRWHLDAGHDVVIVSASYEHYVRVVADSLGIAGALATRLESGTDGICTGRLDGPNCRGVEKVRRLDAWLAERDLRRAAIDLWAYGDSTGDRELLDYADHPVWARKRLGSVAPAPA